MERRRVAEGVAVIALLFGALALFGDPRRTFAMLESVDPVPYAGALATTLAGLVIWSGALAALLRGQGVDVRPYRFVTPFVAGMGVRSVVPGGSVSGPAVLGYVVGRTTDASTETAVAMAYVNDVALWIGSAAVGAVGVLGLLLFRRPSGRLLALAGGLVAFAAVGFGIVGYGIRHPDPVEDVVGGVVAWLRGVVRRLVSGPVERFDPDTIGERLDRFFDAFGRLARDPTHLGPALVSAVGGWFVHASGLYLVFLALGIHVSYAAAILVVPVGGLTEGLSVLPGGIGSVEPAFAVLIVLLTPVSVSTAATVVVLYRLSNYWFRVALGLGALSLLGVGGVRGVASATDERV